MTMVLSWVSVVLSMAYNVRLSLKKLKVLTSSDLSKEAKDNKFLHECKQVLKYWTIFGVLMLFEFHIEFLVRWIPGWYYFKTALILAVTFPHLNISSVVFDQGIVPLLKSLQVEIQKHGGFLNLVSIAIYSAPFLLVDIIFPVKMQGVQLTEFLKKSFRMGSADPSSPTRGEWHSVLDSCSCSNSNNSGGKTKMEKEPEDIFNSTVDYHVPSPVSVDLPLNDGQDVDVSVHEMSMSIEAERLFGPAPTRPSIALTSPFAFDDEEKREVDDTLSGVGANTGNGELRLQERLREEASRRLSTFFLQLHGSKSERSITSASVGRRSDLHGIKRHAGDMSMGFSALFDINVRSPPGSALRRRDTMSSMRRPPSDCGPRLSLSSTNSRSVSTQKLPLAGTRMIRASPQSSPIEEVSRYHDLTVDENSPLNLPRMMTVDSPKIASLGQNVVKNRRSSRRASIM